MTPIETEILTELRRLESEVAAMAAAQPKPNLIPLFNRLAELGARLPDDVDPMLRHYLQKQSWQKARLWLEGLDAENTAGPGGHSHA